MSTADTNNIIKLSSNNTQQITALHCGNTKLSRFYKLRIILRYCRRINNKLGVSTGSLDGYSEPSYKPFAYDPLKYAKQTVKETAKGATGTEFQVGDQVTHAKFGFGIITDMDAKTVTVNFDAAGSKKLAKGIAPIKKV